MEDYHIHYVHLYCGAPALLYEPEIMGPESRVGIVFMHSDNNRLGSSTASELAGRGYRILAANVLDRTASLDEKLLDVRDAVNALRSISGVEKVLLLGHSAGASLFSSYQRAAENGLDSMKGEDLIIPCSINGRLPAADGILFLDAHYGNGAMTLMSLDPAIGDGTNPRERIAELDLFNPANGFHQDGSNYTDEFKARFFRAQGRAENALIREALDAVCRIKAGTSRFVDDEPLIIAGGSLEVYNNKMIPQDVSLLSHTKKEWPVLHAGKGISVKRVRSCRKSKVGQQNAASLRQGALITTAKTFLCSRAVRTTEDYHIGADGVYGIDWDSCYCCTPSNVPYIHVPTLIMGMTGSYEYMASELLYERSAAEDKTIAFVAGASHNFSPAYEAEAFPGEFGDTGKLVYDYVDEWIRTHMM